MYRKVKMGIFEVRSYSLLTPYFQNEDTIREQTSDNFNGLELMNISINKKET